ncbi:hypothetical protein ACQPXH_15210 [Nocardia sp. CA-135953]
MSQHTPGEFPFDTIDEVRDGDDVVYPGHAMAGAEDLCLDR